MIMKVSTHLLLTAALGFVPVLAQASEPVTGASERLEDGKKNYDAICAACHESGADGAPVTGDREDWRQRSSLWEAVLFEHAEKGYIKMPARGASDYATDYDIETAAEYMLTITHPQLPRD